MKNAACRLVALLALLWGMTAPAQQSVRTIGFLTDFGLGDDSVGICKAVMDGIAPGARVIDISHQTEPFNVAMAARYLDGAAPYFARDAVFVAVVDPGVGSARKAVAARTQSGQIFVVPDNGLITLVAARDAIVEVRQITNPAWMLGAGLSSTFHGRDLFAPAAAHLARGEGFANAGPRLDAGSLVKLKLTSAHVEANGVHGEAIGTDGPFGNLIFNVPAESFAGLGYRIGDRVRFTLGGLEYELPFVKTFSDVPEGADLLYIDSRGRLSAGTNQRSFAGQHKVAAGAVLWVPKREGR